MQHSTHAQHQSSGSYEGHSYLQLGIMTAIHFIFMAAMAYLMVYSASEIYWNVNTLYMATWMVAPSVITMLLFMTHMYKSKKLNATLYAVSTAAFVISFLFIRNQTGVDDKQFLKSMIPHHSGAILMCDKANLRDQEIKSLCETIRNGQAQEIAKMKEILGRL